MSWEAKKIKTWLDIALEEIINFIKPKTLCNQTNILSELVQGPCTFFKRHYYFAASSQLSPSAFAVGVKFLIRPSSFALH